MGLYLTPGHTYSDTSPNNVVNGANLNEHVSEAVIKATAISSQTLKDPAALSDEVLVNDGGNFKKETWQQVYTLMVQPGSVIQTVYAEYTANTNLTTVIPSDDTIPQNTEGTEIISASITPRFSTSVILARFIGPFSISVAGNVGIAAIFRDSVANAIAATQEQVDGVNFRRHLVIDKQDSPATTSSTTYKVRVGPATGTLRMNGNTATRDFGGVSAATLVLQEIKV